MVWVIINRALSYLRHRLGAWNTSGEGIHSPYLFYIVRMLMHSENRYYCWTDIEERRRKMLRSEKTLYVTDFGTGQSGYRRVSDIARRSLERPELGQLLFRLLVHMKHDAGRPLAVLELGTCLGITTAYLASAHSENRVVTIEGSHSLADEARANWKKLGLKNVLCVEGDIDHQLHEALRTLYKNARVNHIDLAYIDANHTGMATLRYVSLLLQESHEKTILVVDDIHYSLDMEEAWRQIQMMHEVTSTMDCYYFGLIFTDPHYLRKNYTIRI